MVCWKYIGNPVVIGDDVLFCGHTSGDLNLDGVVDISDLVFMVDYMFTGGVAPEIIEMADVNGSGAVNVADLVSMPAYHGFVHNSAGIR